MKLSKVQFCEAWDNLYSNHKKRVVPNISKDKLSELENLKKILGWVIPGLTYEQIETVWRWHSEKLHSEWLETHLYDQTRIKEIFDNFITEFGPMSSKKSR